MMTKEDKAIIAAIIGGLLLTLIAVAVSAQTTTFDFNQWSTRDIKESLIFGGQTKTIYDLSAPWATSKTHARVMGIDKAAVSVYPIEHKEGKACKMQIEQVSFTVMGVPVHAIAAGSIYLGESNEPVGMRGANEPLTVLNMNYAYTQRPTALYFDYNAYVEQSTDISSANASKRIKHYEGKDGAEVILILQKRWEDENGRIHAERVATAWMRIMESTDGWVENFALPLCYGDIREQTAYQDYQGLNAQGYMCKNSKGKMVRIEEDGYNAQAEPTHLILMFSAGCQPAFSGHVGNEFMIDNVRLE